MKIINIHSSQEVANFRHLINRATNTLEPQKWPEWLRQIDASLERGEALVIGVAVDVHPNNNPTFEIEDKSNGN